MDKKNIKKSWSFTITATESRFYFADNSFRIIASNSAFFFASL